MTELTRVAAALDAKFYLAKYADVAAAGVDPVAHYCAHGWKERRDPSPDFSTAYYLDNNPDVAQAVINPFDHYLSYGQQEGRSPQPLSPSPYGRVREAMRHGPARMVVLQLPTPTGNDEELERSLAGAPVVISVSHDDYALGVGGIQIVVSDESAVLSRDHRYLHLSPSVPEMRLSSQRDEYVFSVRVDGKAFGTFSATQLEKVLTSAALHPRKAWVIHHLMAHSPEVLARLILSSAPVATLFWTHDQFTTCSNFSLMRNNVEYCGVPPVGSGACRICVYGPQRPDHVQRIWTFLEAVSPQIISPSESALEIWLRTNRKYARQATIKPLALLALSEIRPAAASKRHGKMRIAFLGARAHHKGWQVFYDLAAQFRSDERYEFFHFGSPTEPLPSYITNVPVRVTAKHRDAMIDAIALNNIDAVVMWSLCAETFSFSAHEAVAAGTFIVGRVDEGNQWEAIRRHADKSSVGFANAEALFQAFDGGDILDLITNSEPRRGALVSTSGSADLLADLIGGTAR